MTKIKTTLAIVAIIVITSIASIIATRHYMITTAQPDISCTISWGGNAYDYN